MFLTSDPPGEFCPSTVRRESARELLQEFDATQNRLARENRLMEKRLAKQAKRERAQKLRKLADRARRAAEELAQSENASPGNRVVQVEVEPTMSTSADSPVSPSSTVFRLAHQWRSLARRVCHTDMRLNHIFNPHGSDELELQMGIADHSVFGLQLSFFEQLMGAVRKIRLPMNPNNTVRLVWDFLGLFLISWDVIYIPFELAFDPEETSYIIQYHIIQSNLSFQFQRHRTNGFIGSHRSSVRIFVMAKPEEAVEAALKTAVKESTALKRLALTPGFEIEAAAREAEASHAKAQRALAEATQMLQVMAQSVVKNDLPAQQLHRVKEQTLGTWENMGKHGSTSPSRDVKNFFGNRKLRENLQKLSKDLSDAWSQWLKSKEAKRSAAAAASSDLAENAAASHPEEAQTQTQRQIEEVSAGEVDLHAAMVDEYVQDVAAVSQNMKDMQRALLDLALMTQVLDNIERGMEQASASTDGAARELRVTQRNQMSVRRILCMVIVAMLLAVATCAAAIHRAG
eukprot:g17222.t1